MAFELHDGAMGTLLAQHVGTGETVDDLSVRAPELVRAVHADYITAGADVIQTNTFLVGLRDSTRRRRALLDAAFDCAGAARGDASDVRIAATIGPAGDDPRAYWDELEYWLERAVPLVRIETLASAARAEAALDAWKDVAAGAPTELLLGCTISPSLGTDACRWVLDLASTVPAGVAVGLNCCEGPAGLRPVLEELVELRGPGATWVDPSAGLPPHQSAEEWAELVADLVDGLPLRAVGGCCGSTPQHIAQLRETMEI